MITHPLDIEYFANYPAPLMEKIHSDHFSNINSTITFYGPMLYFLARALCVEQVLEIGHAAGYTSYYLANAVKDNAARFKMDGNMFYGVDIIQNAFTSDRLEKAGLPHKLIEMDSINLTPDTFKDITFDIIFQDGCHDTEHVLYELETMYPQLKGEGKGYWIFHDCYGPSEEAFHEIMKMNKEGKYNFEWVRLFSVYGIAILRKMDGYDESKRYWYAAEKDKTK